MNARVRQKLARRKRRIQKRLDKNDLHGCAKSILTASNIHYHIGDRGRAIGIFLLTAPNQRSEWVASARGAI